MGSYFDGEQAKMYEIKCGGTDEANEEDPVLVAVYVTLENGKVDVDVPYFETEKVQVVLEGTGLHKTRLSVEKDLVEKKQVKLAEKYQCNIFVPKEDPKPEITDFDGTDLISLIKDNFAKMWTEDPYFMSAASSNAPGMLGSKDMLDTLDLLKDDDSGLNTTLNTWTRDILFGLVNSFGSEVKDRILRGVIPPQCANRI